MADLGISHTHVNQYGSVRSKKPAAAGSRIQRVLHTTLIAAAFVFVAAVVCGLIG
jgi:DNA-binding transcriptional regulator YdaS (Cro superfamily)